jgi:hypothetical protein
MEKGTDIDLVKLLVLISKKIPVSSHRDFFMG